MRLRTHLLFLPYISLTLLLLTAAIWIPTGHRSNAQSAHVTTLIPNDTPVAQDDMVLTTVNQTIAIDVLANDRDEVDGLAPATVAVSDAPTHGTILLITTTGTISYTPALDFHGVDTFQYSVQDTLGTISNLATVTVTVNDLPVAVPDQIAGQMGETVLITVTANDTDIIGGIDPTTVAIVLQPQHGTATIEATPARLRYTPDTDFFGRDLLQYTIQDRLDATSNAVTVTIQVGEFLYLPLIQQNANADSVLQVLAENGNFTILVDGLTETGVADELTTAAPVTLFAPTNSAFEALMTRFNLTKEQLLGLSEFPDVLRYHILPPAMRTHEFEDEMELETLHGSNLHIGIDSSTLLVNNAATIIAADVVVSDGIIHVIDAVLLPPLVIQSTHP